MKRLAVIVVVLSGVLTATSAQGETTIIEPVDSHLPYQRWVDESKMPTPDVTIEVVETENSHGCPGRDLDYVACTVPQERKIWISPGPPAWISMKVFYHEIGHNVDADLLPTWMRDRFSKIVGAGPAWDLEGEPARYGPNEKFADAWAQCAWRPYVSPRLPWVSGRRFIWQELPIGGVDGHDRLCRMLGQL